MFHHWSKQFQYVLGSKKGPNNEAGRKNQILYSTDKRFISSPTAMLRW